MLHELGKQIALCINNGSLEVSFTAYCIKAPEEDLWSHNFLGLLVLVMDPPSCDRQTGWKASLLLYFEHYKLRAQSPGD